MKSIFIIITLLIFPGNSQIKNTIIKSESSLEIILDVKQEVIFTNEQIYNMSIFVNCKTHHNILYLYIDNRLRSMGMSPLIAQEQILLTNGINNIKINVKDNVGHSITRQIQIIYDGEAPEIRIFSGLEDILPDSPFGDMPQGTPDFPYTIIPRNIYGLVIDKQPSSGLKELVINGVRVNVRLDGSFNYLYIPNQNVLRQEFKRRNGQNSDYNLSLKFEIEDNAGNRYIDESYSILVRSN